ncbi:MAG: 30S ribosome-binding factor RbfA [Bacilli bacterium]|nr:30S ribosome-binding factor RbfA [Bacilli bacterium]MDD4734407.1 30S ribosome-binding factor RbfA [Bacilli bacterium]
MSVKTERIASNIIKEISYILANEVKNKNLKFITVTDCKLTSDLSFAKIYFTTMSDIDSALEALEKARNFIRRQLAERIDVRHTPELSFVYDDSIENAKKIEDIIEKIHKEDI